MALSNKTSQESATLEDGACIYSHVKDFKFTVHEDDKRTFLFSFDEEKKVFSYIMSMRFLFYFL